MAKAVFWEIDRRLAAVARNPQWAAFHRAAGNANLFFVVERHGTSAHPEKYDVVAQTFEERAGKVFSRDLAEVTGACPLRATIDAFHAARTAGFEVGAGLVTPLEALVAPEPRRDEVLEEFGL